MRQNQITTYMDNVDIDVIDAMANRTKLSRSGMIRKMLQDFMIVLQENGVLDENMKLNDKIEKPIKYTFKE